MSGPTQYPSELDEKPLYGDAEIIAASGLALPSLRVLQAAGAICADKEAMNHGGFRRMWREADVLKASIGALMNEHLAWNIRTVAEVLAKTHPSAWLAPSLIGVASGGDITSRILKTTDQDCILELIDRKFLFLRVPVEMTALLPDVIYGQTALVLGCLEPNGRFHLIPWYLEHRAGKAMLERNTDKETLKKTLLLYRLSMAAYGNCLSKTSLNLGLQVRASWRKLHGLETHFFQDVIQPKEGDNKNARLSTTGRSTAASGKGKRSGNNR